MERVLFTLHERACNYGLRWTSAKTRRWLEHFLLVGAIGCFGALAIVHRSFVVTTTTATTTGQGFNNNNSNNNNRTFSSSSSTYNCLPSLPGFDPTRADVSHLIVLPPRRPSSSVLSSMIWSSSGDGITDDGNNDSSATFSRVIWRRPVSVLSSDSGTTTAAVVVNDDDDDDDDDLQQHQRQCSASQTSGDEDDSFSSCKSSFSNRYTYYYVTDDNKRVNISPTDPILRHLRLETQPKMEALRSSTSSSSSSSSFVSHYVYSDTKAYLMLPPHHHMLHQLNIQYIFVSPSDQSCFGEPFLQFLIFHCFIGPDTILWNWIQQSFLLASRGGNKGKTESSSSTTTSTTTTTGYVYNPSTQQLHEVNNARIPVGSTIHHKSRQHVDDTSMSTTSVTTSAAAGWWRQKLLEWRKGSTTTFADNKNDSSDGSGSSSSCSSSSYASWWNQLDAARYYVTSLFSKLGILLQTSFLFFFCTTLVSFTLRETQERMMDFTRELSRRVQMSLPVSDLIATHLIQNLVFVPIMVGMMFFLIEFYGGDKYLAFSVSSIVWFVESFSIVSLRSTQGLQYFPKFFFLLFLLFHVYQSAYAHTGFVYLALTVVWCFIFHSMVFFWHRFELPAVAFGHVTVDRPRMTMTTNNTSTFAAAAAAARTSTPPPRNDHDPTSRSLLRTNSTASSSQQSATLTTPSSNLVPQNDGVVADVSTEATNSIGGPMVPSHPSFSTTSTRNISGLFRNNYEDDSSTGSTLYFMGGEVVVHRNATTVRSTSQGSVGDGNTASAISTNTTQQEGSIPTTATSNGNNLNQWMISRAESNLSLPSVSSYGHPNTTGCTSTPIRPEFSRSSSTVDLDVSQHQPEGDYPDVTIAASSETIPSSNTQRTPARNNDASRSSGFHNMAQSSPYCGPSSADNAEYGGESGGLQAILESRLTPRHRNSMQSNRQYETHHPQQQQHETPSLAPPVSERMVEVGNSGSHHRHHHNDATTQNMSCSYQRMPPTFPELSGGTKKRR